MPKNEETQKELCYTPREVSFPFFFFVSLIEILYIQCGPIGLYLPFYSYHDSLFCSHFF